MYVYTIKLRLNINTQNYMQVYRQSRVLIVSTENITKVPPIVDLIFLQNVAVRCQASMHDMFQPTTFRLA